MLLSCCYLANIRDKVRRYSDFLYILGLCLALFFPAGLTAAETDSVVDSTTGYAPWFEHINNDYVGRVSIALGANVVGQGDIDFKDIANTVQLSEQAIQLVLSASKDNIQAQYVAELQIS